MNYTEIKTAALSIADREDTETVDNIDVFLRIVEARISRKLKVGDMSVRKEIATVEDQEYYDLPAGFAGLRDIEIKDSATATDRATLKYYSPESLNNHSTNKGQEVAYTIIANQLQIVPDKGDLTLELVYYKKVTALDSTNNENWISIDNPDAYIFGLMVEISAFVKDAEAANLWDARFKEALNDIDDDDQETRWSGQSLQIRVET